MNSRQYYVYILMNKTNTVNYTGVTNDLKRRIYEHKNKLVDGFAEKYNVFKLVYFEVYDDINTAIEREKKIKGWVKSKKMKLIRKNNPGLDDLTEIIVD